MPLQSRILSIAVVAAFVAQPTLVMPQVRGAQAEVAQLKPPVAARKPVTKSIHGIDRVDDYDWLRAENWRDVLKDPSTLPPDIRAYIDAENAYSDAVFAPLAKLRDQILKELRGRVERDEATVPFADGPFVYWQRYQPGAEHPQLMRAPRNGGPEQILVDGVLLAAGKPYFSFGDYSQSPDHRLFAFAVDETGSESKNVYVRDILSGRDLPDVITGVAEVVWADSSNLIYVRHDTEHRARFVYRHRIGTDPKDDQLLYEEKDLGSEVSVRRTRSGRLVVITASDLDSTETFLIDAERPEAPLRAVAGRAPNLKYTVDDWGDMLVIRTNADGAEDFKIVTAPLASPGRENWRDLVPHTRGRQISGIGAFSNHLVRVERENALPRIVIRRKTDGVEHTITFSDAAHALDMVLPFEFDTRLVRFQYSSPATPQQIFDYDMESRERVLRRQQVIPSGHEPSNYVVKRLYATTHDNEQVPITVLHRKDLKLDGSAALFLDGYGAYGSVFEAQFDADLISLVDRGFVYAIAHIRGAPEKGERWREAGRRQHKMNTFRDFITVAEYLHAAGYGSPRRTVAHGRSAGGLLVAAVANMRPDLFGAIVAGVPFVDAINTLLDDSLPLTVNDFQEWGNPIESVDAYRIIAAYSPYDNVAAKAYPHMYVTAGISDPRVQYWEPVKWVAKLRATKTNNARIVLATRLTAGHFGPAGRFESLDEKAETFSFVIDVLGPR